MLKILKDKRMWGCFVALLALIVYLFLYQYDNLRDNNLKVYDLNAKHNTTVGYLTSDVTIEQSFVMPSNTFGGIRLLVGTFGKVNQSNLMVQLYDPALNKVMYDWTFDLSVLGDNQILQLTVDKAVEVEEGKTYDLVISSDADANNAVTLWGTEADSYADGTMIKSSEEAMGDLYFCIIDGEQTTVISNLFIFVMIAIIAFAIFLLAIIYFKINLKIEYVFVIAMLVFGSIFMFILPPMTAPDEPRHFITAYRTSNQILGMGKDAVDENGNVYVRECDNQPLIIYPDSQTYIQFYNEMPQDNNMKDLVPYTAAKTINISKFAHLPQSIGITIARLLHLNYTALVIIGRFMNLFAFTALGFFAIRFIPFGKLALFAMAMNPMSLELVSSYSYDALCLGLCALFVGYLLHVAHEKEKVTYKDILFLFAVVLGAALSKIVYICIAAMIFLIPPKKFKNVKQYWLICVGFIAITIFAYIMFSSSVVSGLVSTESGNYIDWAGEEGYTFQYLLSNPIQTIKIYYETLISRCDFYLISMFGGYLGWLEIGIQTFLVFAYGVILVLSVLLEKKTREYEVSVYAKIWTSLIFLGVSFLVLTSMLTSWTPLSYTTIQGVQGRYFLPVLPLLLIVVYNNSISIKKSIHNAIYVALTSVNIFVVLSAFKIIISR